ncbi:MAG TPA: cysteine--tRNA ligase [Phycisphaerae bacterium]|nr:cysteine--tRNA ligase [Phycisphaerae bacterium]
MLQLYNTLTRGVEEFKPIEPGKVGLYTCGPTVYNYAHVGNLRTYVFEDVLKRALIADRYEVRHVMNVTDVGHLVSDADEGEDKMALGVRREGKSVWDLADFYWQAFRRDLKRLNILEPDVWCKATDHIAQQIAMVERLQEKGYTYVIESDGVYFDTSKLPDYGKLARLDASGLRAGARIEMAAGKRNHTDFSLWKFSPTDAQRLMEWPSPWGVGFPGWHIECSTMAIEYLGEYLDIHCGGIDHIAVHHTNEIAQAESALGHQWVRWWMHGEFLTFPKGADGEEAKMSKSGGEFLTLDVLVDHGVDPLAYRYFLLTAHYRQQLAFTWEALEAAGNAMKSIRRMVLGLKPHWSGAEKPVERHMASFRQAVENDLNMPQALAALWGALKDDAPAPGETYATLLEMDKVLALGVADMEAEALTISEEQIQQAIDERSAARKARDYARSDEIRDKLAEAGIVLEDSPAGTTWRRA